MNVFLEWSILSVAYTGVYERLIEGGAADYLQQHHNYILGNAIGVFNACDGSADLQLVAPSLLSE